MIEMHIQAETFLELKAKALAALNLQIVPEGATVPQPSAEAAPKAPKPPAKPKADAPATAAEPTETTSTEPSSPSAETAEPAGSDEPTETSALDYKTDVVPRVLALSQAKGRPGVEALLSKYDVANARDIPAERYGELLADIAAAIDAED